MLFVNRSESVIPFLLRKFQFYNLRIPTINIYLHVWSSFSTLTWVLNRKWWHMTHQALLVWESPQFTYNANSNHWLFTAQHYWNKVSYLVLGANKINKVFTIKGSAENKKNLSRVFGFATCTFPLPEIIVLWRFFQQWLTQIGAVMFLTSSNDIKIKSAVEGSLCNDNHRFFWQKKYEFFRCVISYFRHHLP